MTRFFQSLFPLIFRPKDELATVDAYNGAADLYAKSGAGSNIIEGKYIQGEYLWRTAFFIVLFGAVGMWWQDRRDLQTAIAQGGNHTYAVEVDHQTHEAIPKSGQELQVLTDPSVAEEKRVARALFKAEMRGSPDGGVVSDDQDTSKLLCEAACATFFEKWHDHDNAKDSQFRRDPLLFKVTRLSQVGNASSTTFDIGVQLTETDPATGDAIRTETPSFTFHVSHDPKVVTSDNAWAVVIDSVTQDDAQ